MSHPRCQAAGMQSDDATEPLNVQDRRRSLEQWAAISSQMIDLLDKTADFEQSAAWRPHLSQIVKAVRAFGDRCCTEARELDGWRPDGLERGDAFDRVRDQGQRLVEWLQRMMAD